MGRWVTGTEVESQMCPGLFFLFVCFGAAPALRAPPPSHTPLVACTLIYLSSVGNQIPFFEVTWTQRQLELEQNLLLNHGSDKGLGQKESN